MPLCFELLVNLFADLWLSIAGEALLALLTKFPFFFPSREGGAGGEARGPFKNVNETFWTLEACRAEG